MRLLTLLFVLFLAGCEEAPKPDDVVPNLDTGIEAYDRASFATALQHLKPLAEQGNAEAQYYIGVMYRDGNDRRRKKSIKFDDRNRKKSSNNFLEEKEYRSSDHKYRPKDHKKSLKWFAAAANQGHAGAQNNLGWMYDNGKGVPQDDKKAVKLYTRAAEWGYAVAQYNLGLMYKNGEGVPQNYQKAKKWFTNAAEQGDAAAQLSLGVMHANGEGLPTNGEEVPKDKVKSHMWYNLAVSNGNENAIKFRDLAAAQMTSAQIVRAQVLAEQCIAKNYKGC